MHHKGHCILAEPTKEILSTQGTEKWSESSGYNCVNNHHWTKWIQAALQCSNGNVFGADAIISHHKRNGERIACNMFTLTMHAVTASLVNKPMGYTDRIYNFLMKLQKCRHSQWKANQRIAGVTFALCDFTMTVIICQKPDGYFTSHFLK